MTQDISTNLKQIKQTIGEDMNVLQIQQATKEDIKEIARIESICFPKEEAASERFIKERVETFPESFFVGKIDNRIIGFINGAVTNDKTISDEMFEHVHLHNPEGNYQMIFGLDVLPGYERKGYGKQLMIYMITVSKKRGKKGLVLTCKEHLISFYEQFGYQVVGKSASTHGGATWYDMILEC